MRLRGIAEDAPHPIWATDKNGQVVWANQAYLTLTDLTRVTPPEGAEESVLASPLWPAAPLFAVPAGLSEERLLQWRETLAMPDREEPMWFDVTTVRRGPGTLSFATDASRLVLAEAARLHFVQALAKTFAHLSTGLVIFDRYRQLVLFNPAFVDLTGLPIAFLSGRPLVHTVLDRLREAKILPEPPDYASWRESVAALEAVAAQGQYADTWARPNGRTYRVTGRPHPDGALAFLFEDISDEVGQTRRLRDELDAARAALDITGEAMAVFGATGAVILSSAAYGELWGSPRGAAGPGSLSTEPARWEASCAPSPLLGQLRAGMRIGRQEGRLSRLAGDEWTLRIAPLPRGATLVTFHPLGATQYRSEPETARSPPPPIFLQTKTCVSLPTATSRSSPPEPRRSPTAVRLGRVSPCGAPGTLCKNGEGLRLHVSARSGRRAVLQSAPHGEGWQDDAEPRNLRRMRLAGPLHLPTEADTAALAARLASRLGPGDVLLLSGPVGAGKSAFARALIRARLGDPNAEVPSPTFTLVQTYGEGAQAIWHADLYRLSHPEEVAELGLLAALEDAICLVEWPDRLGSLAPATALCLELAPERDGRQAIFSGPAVWQPRLADLHD